MTDGVDLEKPSRTRPSYPIVDGMKVCSYCLQNQPLSEFFAAAHLKGGVIHRCKPCEKVYKAASVYQIPVEELQTALETQQNRCAICKNAVPLHADHCHQSGKFRGWLCQGCNTSLGGFQENISYLEEAIRYLKEHKNDPENYRQIPIQTRNQE